MGLEIVEERVGLNSGGGSGVRESGVRRRYWGENGVRVSGIRQRYWGLLYTKQTDESVEYGDKVSSSFDTTIYIHCRILSI